MQLIILIKLALLRLPGNTFLFTTQKVLSKLIIILILTSIRVTIKNLTMIRFKIYLMKSQVLTSHFI